MCIMTFDCPKCHNSGTLVSAFKDVEHMGDVNHGDIFICEECASEFNAQLTTEGVEFVERREEY